MSVITIGIQTIMPKTRTPQEMRPQSESTGNSNNASLVAVAKQAPPPGMGQLVDKTA